MRRPGLWCRELSHSASVGPSTPTCPRLWAGRGSGALGLGLLDSSASAQNWARGALAVRLQSTGARLTASFSPSQQIDIPAVVGLVYEPFLCLWLWPETPTGRLARGLGGGQLADLLGVWPQPLLWTVREARPTSCRPYSALSNSSPSSIPSLSRAPR